MTDSPSDNSHSVATETIRRSLARRYRQERHFRRWALSAVLAAASVVTLLFASIISNGYSAFQQTYIRLTIYFDPALISTPDSDPAADIPRVLITGDYQGLIKQSLRTRFPGIGKPREKRDLYALISPGAAYLIRDMLMERPDLVGSSKVLWVPADDDVDMLIKGHIRRDVREDERRLTDHQLAWIDQLISEGALKKRFNGAFFVHGDSRDPELAGIRGAAMGSLFTLGITLALSFPIGVAAAIYLEAFAPQNRWTDLIEVNINNLAAVPSIVFGLLGLAVFINFFGMPRSSPLVGGLVLTLMTLPTIIIASRAALKSVPPSIREAALAIGASPMQAMFHHSLPLAMPGMLTGSIIGMAQAMGESAPLLMIGMVAFVADIPQNLSDPSTVLPVQIYLWADSPERAFVERTSAAIMVLLGFLITMNGLAVVLRRRFERRW
ncbi:MAG: phosphate ABC transporter permease PstA [Gammaproteobacteria bacterium]|nr:phosphate ABC transporter permease PstA [Gammaproteobacteria bacterium]